MPRDPEAQPAQPAQKHGARWPALRSSALARARVASLEGLELRLVGRTLLHAAVVGAAAGMLGAAFFYGLELAQHWWLERAAGYVPLLAHGERGAAHAPSPFRP